MECLWLGAMIDGPSEWWLLSEPFLGVLCGNNHACPLAISPKSGADARAVSIPTKLFFAHWMNFN